MKRAIVPVTCATLDAKNQFHVTQIVASGFLINQRGDFVTAAHVADDLSKFAPQNRCFGAIYLTVDATASTDTVQSRWYRIKNCRADLELDVAICFLTENPFQDAELGGRVAALAFDTLFRYEDGTPVAFTGYPLDYPRSVTSKGFIASRYPAQLVVDKNSWPGASGSPVYAANGKVIGVML